MPYPVPSGGSICAGSEGTVPPRLKTVNDPTNIILLVHPVNAAASMVDPTRQCPPIPRPDAPRWILRLTSFGRSSPFERSGPTSAGIAAGSVISFGAIALLFLGPAGALLSAALLTTAGLAMAPLTSIRNRLVVSHHGDRIDDMAITGAAWSLLRDTAIRFEDAKRMIDQVPTGFDWEEIWPDVNVLLWDTAKHAAKVASLDAELEEVKWAEPGTPQGAYRDALQRRRDDEYRIMQDAQWEAYSLQREAGNAAAAAKMALLHVGSVAALERVIPSTEAIRSRIALAEARARLSLLTEVWAELDPQHTVTAAAIEAQAAERAIEAQAIDGQGAERRQLPAGGAPKSAGDRNRQRPG